MGNVTFSLKNLLGTNDCRYRVKGLPVLIYGSFSKCYISPRMSQKCPIYNKGRD